MKIIDLLESSTGEGYGSVKLSKQSASDIDSILKKLKIKNGIKDLHITLIYDRSNPDVEFDINPNATYSATVKDIEMLGEPDSKWYAITLTLDSPELCNRHKDFIKAGFKHSYPDFLPHLSLKYKPTESAISIIKNNLDLFNDLTLVFDGEKREKIKE